ncbi:lipoprotein [Vreelandella nanhaiensis]|uniref:Secreted protein n=1 Tax=Vreelandella nanhaiensis TaxID=1258546 RepID=A0A3S0XZ17_9GAMM|nr:hypothetical protein [Halomonas nanhaiensis]RUR33699.1 hypothetical protein ELY38_04550 [Halomonas nanhaiensis]
MDKHVNVKMKRPRILSLCMAATAASVLLLAGCGDNGDEEMPPAQQPESMEQGANTSPEADGTVTQEPAGTSSTGQAGSTADDAPVPQESIQPSDEARTNPVNEEPGFGEGTDPMPGANEENDDELTSGQ